MSQFDELKANIEQCLYRLKYHNENKKKAEWIEWLTEVENSMNDLDDGMHDNCFSLDCKQELDSEVASLEVEVSELEDDVEALESKLELMETERDKLQQRVFDLEAELKDHQKDFKILKKLNKNSKYGSVNAKI